MKNTTLKKKTLIKILNAAIQSQLKFWKPLKILFSFSRYFLTPKYPLFSY